MTTKLQKAVSEPEPQQLDGTVRQRLLMAATSLFNRKGYASTSVHEIVEAAGVTKPVLYYYFSSKEGIFLELMKEGSDRFLRIVSRSLEETGGSVRDRIIRLSEGIITLFVEHLPVVRVMNAIYYGPPQGAPHYDFDTFHTAFRDAMRALINEGLASGEFAPGDPEAMTMAVTGAMSVFMEAHLCHPDRAPAPSRFGRVLDIIFRGLAPRTDLKEAHS